MKKLICSPSARLCYALWMCFLLAGCGGGGSGSSSGCAPATPVPGHKGPLVKIMPLGDSITAGTGVDGGSYRLGLWNYFIQDHVNAQFVGSQCAGPYALGSRQNEGHPGAPIQYIAANVDHWIADAPSDYILLMIGTNNRNDMNFSTVDPPKLSALIDQIMKDEPTVTLLVASVPLTMIDATNKNIQAYNAAVRTIVQTKHRSGEKIYYVDVYSVLTKSDLTDEVHPNANGDQKIADVWYEYLKPLLP